eukprot:TRINITY_DN3119_c0_g1_i1.p1 TRINITY_DN3119_c0_g1~~TRINITY_DN3119_c0_g1_i1.p1  ORF type:complete len:497 (+),score=131.68 TRINITY_DN3119_c0_g1_i1:33-1523(+)
MKMTMTTRRGEERTAPTFASLCLIGLLVLLLLSCCVVESKEATAGEEQQTVGKVGANGEAPELNPFTWRKLAIEDMVENWFPKEGIKMGSIEIRADEDESFGVYAAKDIKAKELLAFIPFQSMMAFTQESISRSPYFEPLRKIDVSPTNLQAFWVYIESITESSPWLSYLLTLPRSFDTTLYFSDEEMELLQRSPLRVFTNRRKENIQQNYQAIRKQIQRLWESTSQGELFDFYKEEFGWALSVVWSRAFAVKFPSQDAPTGALVPLADMFNMADPSAPIQVDISHDSKGLYYHAAIDIPANAQIFVKYGSINLPNAILLMDYGFVFKNNKHDWFPVMLSPLENEHVDRQKHKTSLLKSFGLENMIQVSARQMPNDLFRVARVIVATPGELSGDIDPQTFAVNPLNPVNEKAAIEYLITTFRYMLLPYGSTPEEDAKLLETNLTQRARNAIIVRRGEKVILREVLRRLERRLENMNKAANNKEGDVDPPKPPKDIL